MTWHGKTLAALLIVLSLQVAVGLGFWLGRGQGPSSDIVTFDPAKGLTAFVTWSNGRIDDRDFAAALPKFEDRVQLGLRSYAEENGVVVVRLDGVLMGMGNATADVTDQIMTWVLDDEAF